MDFFDHAKKVKTDDEQKKIFVERLGFVFVIDPLEERSYETVKEIFDRMQTLEKRSNLCYSKCFFINKIDLIKNEESRETVKKIIKDIKEMKENYNLESSDYYLMSALNGRGVVDSLKKFVAKIHQKQSEERQKEGIGENNIEDANDNDDIAVLFYKHLLIDFIFF
jgi:GTPase involved in cell partitioning and DNA repair